MESSKKPNSSTQKSGFAFKKSRVPKIMFKTSISSVTSRAVVYLCGFLALIEVTNSEQTGRLITFAVKTCTGPLEDRLYQEALLGAVKNSEFIFTGKIVSVRKERTDENSFKNDNKVIAEYSVARVLVRRFIRGNTLSVSSSSDDRVVEKQPESLFVMQIDVESKFLGNCSSDREKFFTARRTAIFMARQADRRQAKEWYFDASESSRLLELVAAPLPMTLTNLDIISAAVQGHGQTNIMSSYGVYGEETDEGDEEGFSKTSKETAVYYPEQVLVVSKQKDGSTTSVIRNTADLQGSQQDATTGCLLCWCSDKPSTLSVDDQMTSFDGSSWCKPAVLLIVLLLLLLLFFVISGILLYLNYVAYTPRTPIIEEPCEKATCPPGVLCEADERGDAHCRCPSECPERAGSAVCGTDGTTYNSSCHLLLAACRSQRNIREKHVGHCEVPDPCQDFSCPFGAKCTRSRDGNSPICQCPEHCPSYGDHAGSRPICGSDGHDYEHQCELTRAACINKINITVKYSGKCDPCAGVTCPEPELCQLDTNRNPVCRCGETCSLEFAPVCGSDGKTYGNECNLRSEACRTKKELRIIYRGKCSSGINPCLSLNCTHGQQCVINRSGIAQCECIPDCDPILRPVCGTDGRTYDSACHLQRATCLAETDVKVAYTGVCGANGPCSDQKCDFSAICVESSGIPICECPVCSTEFDPVCGSDGITYGNECKLRLESCQHHRGINVLYHGLCNNCEHKECEPYEICQNDSFGEPRCVCPSICRDEEAPVCGSNGVTFKNGCELKLFACKSRQLVTVAAQGNCVTSPCDGMECKNGARCEAGVCLCPSDCNNITSEPVCASDSITYSSECEMLKQACNSDKRPIPTVLYYGDCKEKFALGASSLTTPVAFGKLSLQPTEGTNFENSVFSNSAEKEACKGIRCDFDATCEIGSDGYPRCSCLFDCSSEPTKLVCGSDFRVYQSLCLMKMEACQRQEELRLRPLELCQGMEVKPCNGEPPLIDPSTNQEFDCGSGPRRQDCPSDSYCHQTPYFARCCRKDSKVHQKNCADSWYGCCPGTKIPATGPDHAGCPSLCGCNKVGSYSDNCINKTEQCYCKPGVGGLKCDRCEPGFWGLSKISSGHQGCMPCGCSLFGSAREDCEQMSGLCVCKPGVQGTKCNTCKDPTKVLGPNGCVSAEALAQVPKSCADMHCYFERVCEEKNGVPKCLCNMTCPQETNSNQVVCGNDGKTYASDCQLKLYACRYQKDISVQSLSACKDEVPVGTEWPIKIGGWTLAQHFTDSEDLSSSLSKSTRHLLPEHRYYYTSKDSGSEDDISGFVSAGDPVKDVYNEEGKESTPAIIQVVKSYLGDVCSANDDCVVTHSRCVSGICVCQNDSVQTQDRLICQLDAIDPTSEVRACDSLPCLNGGRCRNLAEGLFECICEEGYEGRLCDEIAEQKEYKIAAFNGRSFAQLHCIKAYHRLTIEMEVKTYSNNGILLYNQQHEDGTGDFISLSIVNGSVEFRYNLGNGPVIIVSPQKLTLRKFHRIVIKRYQKDGLLQVDNSEEVAGKSLGTLRALDLVQDAFVGFVPTNITKVYDNIGTAQGLNGCIRHMKIGKHTVYLHGTEDSFIIKTHQIEDCGENPCSSSPCFNGATCKPIDAESYSCSCPESYSGVQCEDSVDPCHSDPCSFGSTCVSHQNGFTCKCLPGRKGPLCQDFDPDLEEFFTPEFAEENSYIELPRLENVGHSFSLEVWFLAREPDGVILYNGQMTNGKGDFISLNLINGFLQFRFDLGSGIANITWPERISLNDWHKVEISRMDRQGTLKLDNGTAVEGTSGASLNELNLELSLFVGGVPSLAEVSKEAGITTGLNGAVQRVLINGHAIRLFNRKSNQVSKFQGPPCSIPDSPCLNNGLCLPLLSAFACKCNPPYIGARCEQQNPELEVAVNFNGEMFLQFPKKSAALNRSINSSDPEGMDLERTLDLYDDYEEEEDMYDGKDTTFFNEERKGKHTNKYELSIRTSAKNGLLLWSSRGKLSQGNFFALIINDGYIELSFNLGREQRLLSARSSIYISDGAWHSISVQRRKKMASLRIDNEPPVRIQANVGAVLFSSNSKLFIGGAPNIPTGLPSAYYMKYRGCLRGLTTDHKIVHLLRLSDSLLQLCYDNDVS